MSDFDIAFIMNVHDIRKFQRDLMRPDDVNFDATVTRNRHGPYDMSSALSLATKYRIVPGSVIEIRAYSGRNSVQSVSVSSGEVWFVMTGCVMR